MVRLPGSRARLNLAYLLPWIDTNTCSHRLGLRSKAGCIDTGQVSRENVETFRRGLEAFNERSLEGMMEALAHNVEFSPALAGVTDTPYRGEEGVREFLAATDEAFELFHLHSERFEDHGDLVLAVNEVHARGKASGATIRQPLVQIAKFHDGKCVWFRSFRSPQEALEAVGLSQ